jgi:hypothetical protein
MAWKTWERKGNQLACGQPQFCCGFMGEYRSYGLAGGATPSEVSLCQETQKNMSLMWPSSLLSRQEGITKASINQVMLLVAKQRILCWDQNFQYSAISSQKVSWMKKHDVN